MFIPERPVRGDWKALLTNSINRRKALGSTRSVVIVAEGAVDMDGTHLLSLQ